jgi:uncharacterized membrane protein YhiD involved in acid resistance
MRVGVGLCVGVGVWVDACMWVLVWVVWVVVWILCRNANYKEVQKAVQMLGSRGRAANSDTFCYRLVILNCSCVACLGV